MNLLFKKICLIDISNNGMSHIESVFGFPNSDTVKVWNISISLKQG